MLLLSTQVNSWLKGDGEHPDVQSLTFIFFCLNFLAATQDIAVDGWALTMLQRRNVGHASTCNSVGQTAGYFLGYVVFMALESAEFCNTYLRSEISDKGLVTLPDFLWFWGLIFLGTTTLVAIFKKEHELKPTMYEGEKHFESEFNIKETYSLLLDILKMRPIQILTLILLTVKFSFAACDSVSSLKLVDAGVPKDKLALLVIPLVPIQIVLPFIISKHTTGSRPMKIFIKAIPYRLCLTIFAPIIVYLTPLIIKGDYIPYYYYGILLLNYGLYQITLYAMFVSVMAFFARISDPAVGGTYMTLLNTLSNLGGNWPSTVVLWLVDVLTVRKCNVSNDTGTDNFCRNTQEQETCEAVNGKCEVSIDGYYVECAVCLIYGILWFKWGKHKINHLQKLPQHDWYVVKRSKYTHKEHNAMR